VKEPPYAEINETKDLYSHLQIQSLEPSSVNMEIANVWINVNHKFKFKFISRIGTTYYRKTVTMEELWKEFESQTFP